MSVASFFRIEYLNDKLKSGSQYAKKGAKNGFFHILGGNTLVQCINALVVLLYPRIMGKEDYATYSAAIAVLNYLLIFNGLGLANGILRYCAVFDKPEDKKSYFVYAVKFGILANCVLIVVFGGVIVAANKLVGYRLPDNSTNILIMLTFTSFFAFIFLALQYYLRANKENKLFSSTSVIFSASYAGFQVVLAIIFKFYGKVMEGAVVGRYLAYFAAVILAVYFMRKLPALRTKAYKLKKSEKKSMVKYSVNYMIANSFSQLMPNNESMLVSNMVSASDFSDFTASQNVPSSVTFITNAIMIYVFPYFAKNYKDGKWIYKNTKRLVIGMSVLMVVVTILGLLFAPEIVMIFGKKFQTPNAVKLTRLFFIAYGVSGAVRMPVGNVLAAIGEVRFNIINSIITFAIHLVLCWYLTSHFGIGGAAYGLLTGYVVSSAVALIYLRYYCKKLQLKKDDSTVLQDDEDIEADEKELL
jgi:O-antigen/teichoic acid export membrane protein